MKSCSPGQWVGGITPEGSGLQLRCCWYAPLLDSEDRGIAMVTNGQLVVGGEVTNDGDVDGFDYIADIKVAEIHKGKCVLYFQETQTRTRTVHCIDFYQTGTAPGYPQTQTVFTSPHNLQKITQTSYYLANQPSNNVQAPIDTHFVQQNYIPFSHVAQPQPQPFGQLFNSALNPVMTPFQPQLAAVAAPSQSEVPFIMSTIPVSTFPPLTFPSLDKISRIDIPSVEDVENVIPPVQKAILTTVAKFFGVL
uniref:DOMON domain-containing protein n=1 Tax=Angiostrongylus cantonensis TaxID=6313 RepID=A0A0K0D5T4_ANGCA